MASGGPQNDFVARLDDRYICPICLDLLTEPILVECCGKNYCEECFQKCKRRCSFCLQKAKFIKNREKKCDINQLQVYCSNKEKGCTWVGELSTQSSHIETQCGYVEVVCPQKCKKSLYKQNLEAHKNHLCLCRAYRCEHCGLRGTYHTITGECGENRQCLRHKGGHYSECPQYLVPCPNNCSVRRAFRRSDIPGHCRTCPLELVECSFSKVGCTEKIARKDIDSHIASSDHDHLLLMMKAFNELTVKLDQQQSEMRTIKRMIRRSNSNPFGMMMFPFSVFDDSQDDEHEFRLIEPCTSPKRHHICIFD